MNTREGSEIARTAPLRIGSGATRSAVARTGIVSVLALCDIGATRMGIVSVLALCDIGATRMGIVSVLALCDIGATRTGALAVGTEARNSGATPKPCPW